MSACNFNPDTRTLSGSCVLAPAVPPPPEKAWTDYSADLAVFFGVQVAFFFITPGMIMIWRFLRGWRDGLSTMLRAPVGRVGEKRSPAAALRFFLFQESSLGYWADVAQVRGRAPMW
jgi:hypothetical protein